MGSPEEKVNGLELNPSPIQQNGKSAAVLEAGEVRPKTPPVVVTPESEAERLKQEKINKKPLWYCRVITSYPKAAFFVTLGIHILMLAIMGILFRVGYDIFPITFDRIPLSILDNEDYLHYLAWIERNENDGIIERLSGETGSQAEGSQLREQVQWIYESKGGNVFTQANLQAMKVAEDRIYDITDFQEKYCYRPEGTCSKPDSVLRFFDGTHAELDSAFDNPDFSDYINVIYRAYNYSETKGTLLNLIGKDYEITTTKAQSRVLRATVAIGFPLEGYATDEDDTDDQQAKLETYMLDTYQKVFNELYESGVGDMHFVYTSGTLISVSITSFVYKDIALIIGSLILIFVFMCIQTGSLWLTGFALLSIVTSFCATNLVYRILLDYRYIGIFHVLALFIILGIGADDVFVFVDTWKETSHNKYPSLAHRMSHCYRRASLAMMYTSLTTAIAFIVSATSPFLGINSFGVFAGLLVLVNYMSVIIYFPTVVIMYHLYFEKYKCCCCCPKGMHHSSVDDIDKASEIDEATRHSRKHPVVRFFRTPYYKFVTHKVARWFILSFFVIMFGVFLYFTTQIKVNEEQVKFLPDSTNIGKYLLLNANDFDTGDYPQRVLLVFGLQEQDLSSCHKTDPDCTGTTVWDDSFSLNSDGSQQAILELCNTLKTLDDSKLEDLKIRKNPATNIPEVKCFMQNLADFLDEEENREVNSVRRYPNGTDFSIPLNESQVSTIMSAVSYIYNETLLPEGFTNWFEIGASFWLYNGFQPGQSRLPYDFTEYNLIVGEEVQDATITEDIQATNFSLTYKYANRLRYAAVIVNTTINPNTLGYPKGLAIRESWEEFFSDKLNGMPNSLKGGYQVASDDLWHWLHIQKTLVSSAVTGIAIGIALAFPILVIATMNIIVGTLATLTIACITVSVTGLIPILGWKLGFLESLNLVLLVGLAVDYCVHMAEGYSRSVHTDRKSRVQDALEEVGISVLSGACTSLGASFFLLFATILFFTQFGIFMFCTIGLSMLYSLGFFVTLLGLIGPQGKFGSLWPLVDKCTACCCKRKKSQNIDQPEAQITF